MSAVTWEAVRQEEAGARHITLLDEYLRQGVARQERQQRRHVLLMTGRRPWLPLPTGSLLRQWEDVPYSSSPVTGRLLPMKIRHRIALAAFLLPRMHRRDVMTAARQQEEERRRSGRSGGTLPLPTPLESLRSDIARGSFVRSTALVTEERTIPAPDLGKRNVRRFTLTAPGYMVQLERLAGDYSAARRASESLMRHGANGGAVLPRVSGAVNAPSIAASARPRVSDSHDARPAKDRSTARGYSPMQFARDVTARSGKGGECRSVTIAGARHMSAGFLRLVATERLLRGVGVSSFTPPTSRSARQRRAAVTTRRYTGVSAGTLAAANGGDPNA